MAEHRHEDIRRLFHLASELPRDQQRALLDRECGADAALRTRIEAMLAAAADDRFLSSATADLLPSADAPATLENPPSRAGTHDAAAALSEAPGSRIGPYKLLQLLGEGGFGSVFMAEQEKPVARKVALKIIKLGMDTRQVIARFEAERQALAMMDHPHIARVLDAGSTDTGRPYFVMDLVKGEPISEYCDRNNLGIEDRLELFAQVCHAVQHAHTKGIIHRDIKPTNILVSTQDGRPSAKVIDFGIAKATASKLTEKTLFTEHRQLIGTPEYMSPEQAEGSLDIDTRTDVYSLGVLLYELLTGSTPFSTQELRSGAYAEIQRIIREVEPPKPSTRLSQNAATLASVAARRKSDPRRLGTAVRGELDWIVMKALEKDRQRRYETANGLAMDVRRFLAGETVVAVPPSAAYLFTKFVRRNKRTVAAAAAVAITLVLGIIAIAWQARIAGMQRDRAVAAEALTRQRAEELSQVAQFQTHMLSQVDPTKAGRLLTDDVTARFDEALTKDDTPEGDRAALVKAFGSQWSRINATDTARELIDRTILRPAVAAIDKQFADQPAVDAALRQALADRYRELGLYAAASPLQERALATRRKVLGEDHPDTLASISSAGALLWEQGKPDQAEVYFRETLEKRRRLLGDDHESTLEALSNLGIVLDEQGKLDQAEQIFRQALEKLTRLHGEQHPGALQLLNNLGLLLREKDNPAEAEKYLRQAVDRSRKALGDENENTLNAINNLGLVLQDLGKMDQAEALLREGLDITRRVAGEEHPDTITAINNLGVFMLRQRKWSQAEPFLREALEKLPRVMGPEHPNTLLTIISMGGLLDSEGKFAAALDYLAPAEPAIRRVFTQDNPGALMSMLVNLGKARAGVAEFPAAEANLLEAYPIAVKYRGPTHRDVRDCAKDIAAMYTAWHAAEPGAGHDAKAAQWNATLADLQRRSTQPAPDPK